MDLQKLDARTGVQTEKLSFTWEIENFDAVRNSDEFIRSQRVRFEAGESIGQKNLWSFFLVEVKKKEGVEEKPWIGIYMRLDKEPAGIKEVNASYSLRIRRPPKIVEEDEEEEGDEDSMIVNPDEEDDDIRMVAVEVEDNFYKAKTNLKNYVKLPGGWGWAHIIRKDAKLELLPLVDGCLRVELDLIFYGQKPVANLPKPIKDVKVIEEKFKPKFIEKLQQDFGGLLKDVPSTCDAETKIISKDKVEIPVIRAILSARSPMFETMFRTNMKENKTGIVEINELHSKTISVLLEFIYTGNLNKDWSRSDIIVELVYAAGKYQFQDLLDFFNHSLASVCKKETCGKLLNLAKKLSLKVAEEKLFEFAKKHVSNFEDMILLVGDGVATDIMMVADD